MIGYYFETEVKAAVARNSQRRGRQLMPERGIYGTHKRLVPPTPEEGCDKLYLVRLLPEGEYMIKPLHPEQT